MESKAVEMGVFDLVAQSGLVVQLVLYSLLFASVFCWAIIFTKYQLFRILKKQNTKFLDGFWNSRSLDEIFRRVDDYDRSPVAAVFKSGFVELKKFGASGKSSDKEVENINRAMVRATSQEVQTMERYVGWLATTASAAPFVGLFGTVWGIMNSFQNIGATGAANLAVVAPGIAEALIATATGLAAAIPAVIAYNSFVQQIKKFTIELDCFAQDFLNIVQRGLIGKK